MRVNKANRLALEGRHTLPGTEWEKCPGSRGTGLHPGRKLQGLRRYLAILGASHPCVTG
jgi:hypothetical protein